MSSLSTKTTLHARISAFVKWIAPEKETRDKIKEQSKEIKERISVKAQEDGLTVTDTPYSGSFAKKTGLRRHIMGEQDIEGQDVDLPFVVKKDKETEFGPLIIRFEKYARACYPKTDIPPPSKSSVKMKFTGTKLSYDIVPMFSTDDPLKQILIRNDGEIITTSIQKHRDFIRNRIKESDDEDGIVLFNDCIRLMKWWREVKIQQANSPIIDEIPSFLIDLLAAKAYDKLGVETTYAQTLSNWFFFLANVAKKKETVWFNDYYKEPKVDSTKPWNVLDPVMPDNNIVKNWPGYKVDLLSQWFQEAGELLNRAIVADDMTEDTKSLEHLKSVFGKIFESHCN